LSRTKLLLERTYLLSESVNLAVNGDDSSAGTGGRERRTGSGQPKSACGRRERWRTCRETAGQGRTGCAAGRRRSGELRETQCSKRRVGRPERSLETDKGTTTLFDQSWISDEGVEHL
jgi:hypothetical protein